MKKDAISYLKMYAVMQALLVSFCGKSQVSDSSFYNIESIPDTIVIDRSELSISNSAIKKILFPISGVSTYPSTPLNDFFAQPKTSNTYWVIKNYQKDVTIAGIRNEFGGFIKTVTYTKRGHIFKKEFYDSIEIWDLKYKNGYFWLSSDTIEKYGEWTWYRRDKTLKKIVTYYPEIDDDNIYMMKEVRRFNRKSETKKSRKQALLVISRRK